MRPLTRFKPFHISRLSAFMHTHGVAVLPLVYLGVISACRASCSFTPTSGGEDDAAAGLDADAVQRRGAQDLAEGGVTTRLYSGWAQQNYPAVQKEKLTTAARKSAADAVVALPSACSTQGAGPCTG